MYEKNIAEIRAEVKKNARINPFVHAGERSGMASPQKPEIAHREHEFRKGGGHSGRILERRKEATGVRTEIDWENAGFGFAVAKNERLEYPFRIGNSSGRRSGWRIPKFGAIIWRP